MLCSQMGLFERRLQLHTVQLLLLPVRAMFKVGQNESQDILDS